MPLASSTKLGPYEIQSPLGAGGMGEVYRARDTRLKRDVAIKILPQSLSLDADRLRRFEQEALATAALSHPNILAVFDIGASEGSPYVVSELLEGETLRERLRGGAMPMRKALDCALQVAHGLAAAHEKGVVHRDLKPENLFLTKARFQQHYLPEESVVRNIVRYESMLDREFHRCLDRLDRLQQRRRAIGLRGAGPADAPSAGNGQILDGNDLLNT